jgi:hypothetical protein
VGTGLSGSAPVERVWVVGKVCEGELLQHAVNLLRLTCAQQPVPPMAKTVSSWRHTAAATAAARPSNSRGDSPGSRNPDTYSRSASSTLMSRKSNVAAYSFSTATLIASGSPRYLTSHRNVHGTSQSLCRRVPTAPVAHGAHRDSHSSPADALWGTPTRIVRALKCSRESACTR